MKSRIVIAIFVLSLLANLIVIPVLGWEILSLRTMYRRNVDYASELAYAVGYHKALGDDIALELDRYPTRLEITKVDANSVTATIWPARNHRIELDFSDPTICNATVLIP